MLIKNGNSFVDPEIGTFHYYDLMNGEGSIARKDATWVCENPNPGWEEVKGLFAFYPYDFNGVISETNDVNIEEGPSTSEDAMLDIINQGGYE